MKIPIQAQPIIRGISTAKIIGDKGIFLQKKEDCQSQCRHLRGFRKAACIAACLGLRINTPS